MMLNCFPLRSTSGGSQRVSSAGPRPQGQALAPPQAGRSHGRSLLSSDTGLSTCSGPTVGRRPLSSNSQSRVAHSQGRQLSSTSDSQVLQTVTSPRPVSPAGSSDIDRPISADVNAGVRCRRDSSVDAMQLTPRCTKQLKTYAQQLATDHGVPLKKLLAFIEQHIMDFIKEHSDLFKISEGLFNDTKLRTLLGKLVMRLLATIRGSIKTALTTSVSKKLSIMDVLKPIIHSSMEVDSSHWTRFAFLDIFSPYLIPSLHPDLQHHIMSQLCIDIPQLTEEFRQSHPDLAFGHQDESSLTDTTRNDANHDPQADPNVDAVGDEDAVGDVDAVRDVDADADVDGIDDDSADSGFGLQGSPPKWNK
ncbi:hypothetical protein F4604DRAFT_1679793 [Suillus subluteus]|nr:hypothetical protein F4604DRAFT_1679793 [Suillus subluteus]